MLLKWLLLNVVDGFEGLKRLPRQLRAPHPPVSAPAWWTSRCSPRNEPIELRLLLEGTSHVKQAPITSLAPLSDIENTTSSNQVLLKWLLAKRLQGPHVLDDVDEDLVLPVLDPFGPPAAYAGRLHRDLLQLLLVIQVDVLGTALAVRP